MAPDKKKAAAIAAVMTFIKCEEDLVVAQAMAGSGTSQRAAGPGTVNLWAMSGRQAMMQMRNLMQMRSFHGARFR